MGWGVGGGEGWDEETPDATCASKLCASQIAKYLDRTQVLSATGGIVMGSERACSHLVTVTPSF